MRRRIPANNVFYDEYIELKLKDAVYTALLEYHKLPPKQKIPADKLKREIATLRQNVSKKEQIVKEEELYNYAQKIINDALSEIPF